MKRAFLLTALLFMVHAAFAGDPEKPEMNFEKTTIDLGKFTQDTPTKRCAFVFTNSGGSNLYIHQVRTGCRCTGAEFPKHAVKPGQKDSIVVIFNGEKTAPRKFRTSVGIHSNAKNEMTYVYIKGEMKPREIKSVPDIRIEE